MTCCYNIQVGAGTMNPATFLRVNGPEPWNACYPEPSVRPDDSRYGDNPNRVQRHTQFQVIMKPDPGNPQELYLGSLQALGIDIKAHDIRFVEDNWVCSLHLQYCSLTGTYVPHTCILQAPLCAVCVVCGLMSHLLMHPVATVLHAWSQVACCKLGLQSRAEASL